MTREEAHKLVDQLFDLEGAEPIEGEKVSEEPKREIPKDKRVVRTKTSGDRVYLLDEVKKTRQWIAGNSSGHPTGPELLESFGFSMSDVVEIDDTEMMKYQMGSAIYKLD